MRQKLAVESKRGWFGETLFEVQIGLKRISSLRALFWLGHMGAW